MKKRKHEDVGLMLVSLSQIAIEFDMARETVKRRLSEARVRPGGKRDGHAVYYLTDVTYAFRFGMPFPGCARCSCAHCRNGRGPLDER